MEGSYIIYKKQIINNKIRSQFQRINKTRNNKLINIFGISNNGNKYNVFREIREPSGELYHRRFILKNKDIDKILTTDNNKYILSNLKIHNKNPKNTKKKPIKTKTIKKKPVKTKTIKKKQNKK